MKLLIDGGVYAQAYGGGAVRYCDQLVNGLTAHGIEVDLLVREGARLRRGSGYPDCRVVHDISWDAGYDVFHGSYYSDLDGVPGVRTVVTIHDLIDEMLPPSLTQCSSADGDDAAKANAIRNADHLVAISSATLEDLQRVFRVATERVTVIHHGVSAFFGPVDRTMGAGRLARELGLVGPFILHVGGRDGYKNFAFLLKAFAQSRVRDLAHLVAVGSQKHFLPHEREVVTEFDLEGDAMLLGYVSDDLLRLLYSHAALVAMPSLHEGFGYPMIEALACGATVACSSARALVELGDGAPLVFDATNAAEAAAILEVGLTEDHSLRNERGMQIAARFSEETMIASYIKMYEGLVQLRDGGMGRFGLGHGR